MSLSRSDSVAAVIVTHNRVELLEASLRMVAGQRALPSEGASREQRGASESKSPANPAEQTNSDPNIDHIVVVDNGADERVKALVEQVCGGRGVYLASKTNLGGAGGFAYGFLTALALGADAIWCADDDGRPGDEHVLATLQEVAEREGLDEVSPVVCNIDDPGRLAFPLRQGLVWRRRLDELEGVFLPGIASLFNGALISAAAMEVIGVPDYRLFIRGDEVEYHRRLVRSGLKFGTCLRTSYVHPDGSAEFKPILGGKMHTQYPDNEFKRFFTYRNRGYVMSQPGMRKLLPQEYARFAWFFLAQQRDVKGFREWLKLHAMGRREEFRRPRK